jgi:hypothetical protein
LPELAAACRAVPEVLDFSGFAAHSESPPIRPAIASSCHALTRFAASGAASSAGIAFLKERAIGSRRGRGLGRVGRLPVHQGRQSFSGSKGFWGFDAPLTISRARREADPRMDFNSKHGAPQAGV